MQSPRSGRMPSYRGYIDGGIPFRASPMRSQSSRDMTRYGEGEFDGMGEKERLRRAQRLPGTRALCFDEGIAELVGSIAAAHEHLEPLKGIFEEEIQHIRPYTDQAIIDALWEMRFELKRKPNRRVSKRNDEKDDVGRWKEFAKSNRKVKQTSARLENALVAAANGFKPTISQPRKKIKEAEDKAWIERTVSKLNISGTQCLELLRVSRKKYSQFDPLLEELRFIERILEPWKAFADGAGEGEDAIWLVLYGRTGGHDSLSPRRSFSLNYFRKNVPPCIARNPSCQEQFVT
ncbi:uncharacterized protein BDR25DRAFT_348385 [Lindgomyces ingoldianus]|uniref:Uncharacterized protein n=1 Tax=Lindgomyces ingoldianus TaxID=673940 RepID=A0ACB6RH52_9PLEO|nr:uncharacterized protein BDR25DRAFT_348385 [Lindgomyces ingoldianus]KAF2478103.1 hypothetical protein BDR25DRAFT_348385 [Lindgomyces ingoldianus]